jgi:hypothetical protein
MFSHALPVTTVEENWKGVTGINNLGWGRVVAYIVAWSWSTWLRLVLPAKSICEGSENHSSDNQIFSEFAREKHSLTPVTQLHGLSLERANFPKTHEKWWYFFLRCKRRYCWLKCNLKILLLVYYYKHSSSTYSALRHWVTVAASVEQCEIASCRSRGSGTGVARHY